MIKRIIKGFLIFAVGYGMGAFRASLVTPVEEPVPMVWEAEASPTPAPEDMQ